MPDIPPTELNPDEVPSAMAAGALLLTSSPQLAVDWRRRLVTAAVTEVVATPAVETWTSWLAGLARGSSEIPVPYTELQERQLWARIIAEDVPAAAASGLARHATRAYRLMREYAIDTGELAGGGEEAEALARWIAVMQGRLKREGRVLAADVPALLLPQIGDVISVEHIVLDGFDRTTPIQQSLLDAVVGHGVRVSTIADQDSPTKPTLTACPDTEAECRHVAGRVAAILKADPNARIGIVNAGQPSPMLGRVLGEALLSPGQTAMQAVSMTGAPLAARPLIRQLLDVLALAGERGVPHAGLAPLLFSPGVRGHGEEAMARAALDAKLRGDNRYYLSFRALQGMAAEAGMPQLANVVEQLAAWDTAGRTAGEWVGLTHGLLQALGFLQADVTGRSPSEIREFNAFRECMASLVAADAVRERMRWGEFLGLLSSVCKETPFALPVACPGVCVLPIEQIAGLRFDIIFAIGCDDEVLPLAARALPLLPLALQRRYELPGTTAGLAFASSGFLWGQLGRAASVVHASFAMNRDERELNASPLLAGVVAEAPESASEAQAALVMEHYDDAPSVPLGAEASVAGGSDIIKNQSACPFRAFATHRLALAPLGETRPGIEPREKGSLLHHALQYIWEALKSQQALLTRDEEQTTGALISAAIDHAWGRVRIPVAEASRDYERRRMSVVLHEWLSEERKRPSFTVECCEKPYSLRLPTRGAAQFTVRLKADRIDRDGEGRKILIDYKSGQKQAVGKWIGERMEQPQLPLYSMAEDLGAEDAVCFARVRSGECGFEGLSGEDTGIEGVALCDGMRGRPDDWPALLDAWRQDVDALAGEFVAGRSEVVPRNPKACEHCGLEAVCRIDEIGFVYDADEDEEGDVA